MVYTDNRNRSQPYVLMDYEAFDLLVGSFTGNARPMTQKLKARFRELEQQLTYKRLLSDPNHLMEITRMYCQQVEENKRLSEANQQQADKIVHDAPLVEYAESVKACDTDVPMAVFAKTVRMRLKDCLDWFVKKGVIIRMSSGKEQGYRVSAKGRQSSPVLLKTVQTPLKSGFIALSVQLTPVGQIKFHEMITKERRDELF